jgi:hypothetical protein
VKLRRTKNGEVEVNWVHELLADRVGRRTLHVARVLDEQESPLIDTYRIRRGCNWRGWRLRTHSSRTGWREVRRVDRGFRIATR